MNGDKHDEDVVTQLTNFGYSREQIIEASNDVVDYKDINSVVNKLNSTANTYTIGLQSSSATKNATKKAKSKMNLPSHQPQIKYSKSATTPRTKKLKTKAGNSWIKSSVNKHDPSVPATFSRQQSIVKLRQIAAVSKKKKKPKQITLIDIIYESDDDKDDIDDNDNEDDDEDDNELMPPMFDRRLGLSADSAMNQLLNQRNQELKKQKENKDTFWMKQKKKKKKNHIKAELNLLFDFRDFERDNNRSKEYKESIAKIETEEAEKAIELMKQKTFNAVKLQQDIKEKAIQGFNVRLEAQKEMIQERSASVHLNDDDFRKKKQQVVSKKMYKRDILKQALSNEYSAMEQCVMIVEELGFLKYMKDDEMYKDLMKSKQNAERNKHKEIKEDNDNDNYDLFVMTNSNLLISLKKENTQLLMRIFSRSLVMIKGLRFIELCNCGVDDYFMSQICLNLLQKPDEIEINTLNLQSNCIGDNGMLCLCELIKINNKYLKVIKLQNNRIDISTSVCMEICTALEVNDFVIKFEFGFRHYGERDRSYRALKRNIERARIQRVENKLKYNK